ncbi:MAG: 30S ribosomal protein S8 [Verrucomicrobiales bacterium]|nr:30S ribosomal protein S8 [Verrucomicrobiales bacterium]HAA87211.1 30S ribosomal protein S8 [Verrucomicrobiales bacterium]|tara:strand:- start:84 stop:482 length:399 start_codon:yes stop_codon:yes gene_type:complete
MAALSDPISDFLIRFKNASRAGKEEFTAPFSKIKAEIARILKEEGYIWSYEVDTEGDFPSIRVKVRYIDGTPALTDLKKESKPGRRRYIGVDEIPKVLGGLGIAILSTSQGLMAGHHAKKKNVGGELIASVW